MDIPTTTIALTPTDAAAAVGVSVATIRTAIHTSDPHGSVPPLPARRLGSRYLISRQDLESWFEALPAA